MQFALFLPPKMFVMKRLLFFGFGFLLIACSSDDRKSKNQDMVHEPLSKSANSDSFSLAFNQLMTEYYTLTDDFIDENDTQINISANQLRLLVDSLPLTDLKADSNIIITARTYTQGISSELAGLLGEKDLEAKRKAFQMVSDQLYDLIRTVQYSSSVVYHNFCPMAFNNQGANWLSNTPVIRNPYIPKKMLTCGEVKDSIDFRPKH